MQVVILFKHSPSAHSSGASLLQKKVIHSFLKKGRLFQNKWKYLHKDVNRREQDIWKTGSSLSLRKGGAAGSNNSVLWVEVVVLNPEPMVLPTVYCGVPALPHHRLTLTPPAPVAKTGEQGPLHVFPGEGGSIVWTGRCTGPRLGHRRTAGTLQHVALKKKQRKSNKQPKNEA